MAITLNLGITSPAENATIQGPSLTVTGFASKLITKNSGEINEVPVNVSVSVTGARTKRMNNVRGWSASFSVASPGPKTITAKAISASNSKTVTRRIVLRDDKPPLVTINQPSQGQKFEGPGPTFVVRISGTAKDHSNIQSVQFRVDGGSFQNVNKDSGSAKSWNWSKDIPGIGEGTHTIEIRATDQHNNVSKITPTTTRAITTFRDNGPPEIDITSPETSPHKITWREGGVDVDVSGTAIDLITSVKSVQWHLDGGTPKSATNVSGTWSSWRFTANIPTPGLHEILVVATDIRDNQNTDVVQIDVAVSFELENVGFAPYLEDLMTFTRRRLRQMSDSTPIEKALLKNAFHQHYDRITQADYTSATTTPVAQVRIAIEVLRSYLSNSTQFPDYLETAYRLLLANLGTSYAEIRLVRTADADTRLALANRLGIAVSGVNQLFIVPDHMTEAKLQTIFGLMDTTQDPLALAVDQADLLTLRLSTLHSNWLDQDQLEVNNADIPIPVIDPDIIDEPDLKSPITGNTAHDLLVERKQWVAEQRDKIQQARESKSTPLEGFDHVLILIVGNIDLPALEQKYQDGVDIEPELRGIPLALDAFFVLLGIRKLAETGVVADSEWTDLYNILLQVKKQREFTAWATEEINANLVSEPAFFIQSKARPELTLWRSSWRARRNWENKLEARINQREGLIQAYRSAIEATEAVVLPILRDRLIETIDRKGFPAIDVADWLTQRLSISFKYSGDQRLTRLEQGVETLQDLMLTLRTGRLDALARLPLGTAVPKWELALSADYTENDFDKEWDWMGSFATWRGAMFAFGYPENYLLPTLRDKKEWTNAFGQLVKAVRQAGRLTANKAETIATEYVETLNRPKDEDGDNITYDIELTSQLTKQQLRERRTRSKAELEPHVDLDRGGLKSNAPAHLKEVYFFVPMFLALSLQKKGEYIAALDWYQTVYAYELPPDERKIYFGLEAEEALPTEFRRTFGWLLDGLDVFDIAKDRANATTRFTMLSIVRCYLAFADAEFTRESNESIPFARRLYITALKLLNLLEVPPPVAHWSFDEDGDNTAPDVTGNGHTATLNGTRWEANGWRGGSISFDGSNGAEVPHAPSLALGEAGGDFSVTFALFLREDATGSLRTLMKKGSAENLTPGIELQPDDNRVHFRISTTANTNEGATSKSAVKLNEWTHIAYVKQGRSLKLYINGQIDSEKTLGGDSIGFDAPLFIGNDPQHNGANALIDEIQIFDRALGADAVIALAGIDIFPPNPVISALRQQGELNLRKLRSGRNIAGMERIRSEPAAAELVISDGGLVPPPSTRLRPTAYRYSALIDRAKQLVTLAQQIEANFFAALEKRDAEAYTLLHAQHDVLLTKETVELQDLRIQEADSNIVLMTLHQDRAQTQFDTYNEWINAGANQFEQAMLNNYQDLKNKRNLIADIDVGIAIAGAALGVASANFGKEAIAGAAATALGGLNVARAIFAKGINDLEFEAQKNAFNANLERRKDEWRLQSALAHQDMEIAAQQIYQAEINKLIVTQERAIASMRSDQAQAVVEFLNNKFTNIELYEWMSDILSEVYSYFLQQATAMAQLAANQLAFERQERPPAFIRTDYWQAPNEYATQDEGEETPDRRGITGSARLLQDIFQLDQHAFETNKRKLQLVENFSLARLVPFEFQRFRETGILPFATPMSLFDQGFPGHYLRLIKRVRVSVVGLIPPTQGIRATLSAAGVSHVVTGDEVYRRTEVRRPSEMIAFTSPSNATGLFELQPENELLLPFETMGVDANWELQLPKAANRFNFDTLADVIFTLEYTALHSADYRHQVIQEMDRSFSAEQAYSIKQDFPDLWYHLHHPDALVDEDSGDIHAQFTIERPYFPPNLDVLAIDHVVAFFVRSEGADFEVNVADLRFDQNQSGSEISYGGATSMDGVISTRRANATGWLPLIGETPVGTWTMVFSDTQEFREHFADEQITDILFVIGYSGETPPWPS